MNLPHQQHSPERAAACRECLRAMLPALRYWARLNGYAVAVHGSLRRDIDLLAVPWREDAVSPLTLIDGIWLIVKAVFITAERKGEPDFGSCGRLRQAFYLTMWGADWAYLDLGVMPRSPADYPKETKGGTDAEETKEIR